MESFMVIWDVGRQMKQITVRKMCPNCPKYKVELKYSGIAFTTNPLYRHTCDTCFYFAEFDKIYPYNFIEYEPNEKEERWEK
jgi:hypothetical protein